MSRFSAAENAPLLLIEPIWNRNNAALADKVMQRILLIEPIWNRNDRSDFLHCTVVFHF